MEQLVKRPVLFWLVSGLLTGMLAAALGVLVSAATVSAAPEEEESLDCLSCHTRALTSHDKLGEGSKACWVCHDRVTVGKLRLLDGTQLPLSGSPQVCGQCHTERYKAWNEERHGVFRLGVDAAGLPVKDRGKCIVCHDPHQPKTEFATEDVISLPAGFSESGTRNCLSCHARVLKGHDKLGKGNEACRTCHSSTEMGVLHLAGGETTLPLSESAQLCAQCHQKRYEEWTAGTHGMPSWEEGIVEIHGVSRVTCISCHNPHQPQVALLNITKSHPAPTPPPPAPPRQPLIILGISLLVVITAGLVIWRGGRI